MHVLTERNSKPNLPQTLYHLVFNAGATTRRWSPFFSFFAIIY